MGIFSKKPGAEEIAAREANRDVLSSFTPTACWGVKKVQTAMQFIYDEDMRSFVVVEGPLETFKDKDPFVVSFDQVTDVWLEVDEWFTEDGNKFNRMHSNKVLLQEDYSKVFWHYDFYLNIRTTHPFCEHIRYQMNYNTNILKVPGFHLFYHRGLELNGDYRGPEIKAERLRLEKFCEDIKAGLEKEKCFDLLTGQRPDGIIGRFEKDLTDDRYVSRIENVIKHVKRAGRISKLLLK